MQIDGSTLLLALAATTAVTLLFSLAPALRITRGDLHGAFREEAAVASAGGRERRRRDALVAIQVAFTLMLLAGAGLMIAGFRRMVSTLEEARPEQVLALRAALPQPRYSDNRAAARFVEQVLEGMQALPDVVKATVASNTPLNNSPNPGVDLVIEGHPPLEPGERRSADLVAAAPDYLPMIGAALLRGRDFASSDGPDAPPVAIISETAARRYWPEGDPVGRRVRLAADPGDGPWITIVGVAGDVRQSWFDREVRPQIYRPYRQAPRPRMWFLLRTAGDPAGAAAGARACIREADRDLPADQVKTLARLIVDEASPLRFAADLMLAFGVMALLLSAVGVYGVMSYAAARRAREIGIRIALGATRRDVLSLVMRRGAITTAAGMVLGLALAYALSRVMTGLLYGVVAPETGVIIGCAALLAGVTMLSCYLPARRAAAADPMAALREE